MKKRILIILGSLIPMISFAESVTFPDPLHGAGVGLILRKIFFYGSWAAGVLLTILIVYASFVLMLSKGDPKEIDKARKTIIFGIIGFILIFFAQAISIVVKSILSS